MSRTQQRLHARRRLQQALTRDPAPRRIRSVRHERWRIEWAWVVTLKRGPLGQLGIRERRRPASETSKIARAVSICVRPARCTIESMCSAHDSLYCIAEASSAAAAARFACWNSSRRLRERRCLALPRCVDGSPVDTACGSALSAPRCCCDDVPRCGTCASPVPADGL